MLKPYKRSQASHALLADAPRQRLVVPRLAPSDMMGALEVGDGCACGVSISAQLQARITPVAGQD